MKPLERFSRRVPCLRFCILTYQRQELKRQRAIRWEYRRTVFSTLGQVVSVWASIEMIFDHLIDWYHPVAGAQTIQPDLPVTFDRKMDYLNKMARDPNWQDGGAAIRHFRTEAIRARKQRLRATVRFA